MKTPAKKEATKIMTHEAAERIFLERMKAFRDDVFAMFLQPPPPDINNRPDFLALVTHRYKDDCLNAFSRVWVRKVKRGLKLLAKRVMKQSRPRKYGPVRTRHDTPSKAEQPKEEKPKPKPKKKKKRGRPPKPKPPYKLGKKAKRGRPVYWFGARRSGHHAKFKGHYVY